MQEKVWNYMQEHHMVKDGDRIIAGVSGGADSVALFCLMEKFREICPFDFCVVHVNHNLRGQEALRDADFVRQMCRQRQVEYFEYSVDVKKTARERKLSCEEAGRMLRMEAFEEQRKRWNGTKIALAHHKNDLAETMLHHLCRGSGLRGLCGIMPVQGEKIRPLLCLEREEIEQYLKEQGMDYVTDSTNATDDYTRNRIRHQILPVLEEQVNRRAVAHMAEASEKFQKIEDYLQRQAQMLLESCRRPDRQSGFLDEKLFDAEPVLQEYVILRQIEQICKKRKDVTSLHVREILALADKPAGKYIQIPGKYRMVRLYDGILLEEEKTEESTEEQNVMLVLDAQGTFRDECVSLRIFPNEGQKIPQKRYTKWLNYDKISEDLWLRTRRPGDYLVVNPQGGRKKIKDYFIDSKVPRQMRDQIPLFAAGQEILWVVGYRISEAYKVTEHTKTILEIEYKGGCKNVREN
ncbi:MAG: tRNA lysidine(34) synthetase TilS [Eubacteriales bacterium]|nr:tRNA lysidine(34) synthetase TilS [Eubacteriales bacterium]